MTGPSLRAPGVSRLLPLVLLALGMAAVIAWAVRDRAAYLDIGGPPLFPLMPGGGHHGDGTGSAITPPPAITREPVANYAGIAVLAAHLTVAGVLVSAAVTRRLAGRRARTGAALVFAASCALWAALVTVPTAKLSVGNAITLDNSLAASVLVLQYSFVLAVAVTALVDLRLSTTSTQER